MGWRDEPNPEKIIGMKPEELKSRLDSAASKDELQKANEGIEKLNGSLASIQESLKALTTPKPPVVTEGEGEDPTVQVLSDPKKFVAGETKDIRDRQFETQAGLEEMRARTRFAGVFSQFDTDLMESAKKYPWQTRALPGFWESHIKNIVGEKFMKGEIKSGNYPSLLGSSLHGPKSGSEGDPNMGFSDEMASWFKSRGITLDKARKIHDLTVRDGEPMTIAKYTGKQDS